MYFVQIFINGLLTGGIYALVSIGFSMVWGVMGILNISHGSFIMLGAYTTFWLFHYFRLDPFFSIPVSMAALFALGAFLQKGIINHVARAPVLTTAILTWGIDLLFVNLAILLWSPNYRSVVVSYRADTLATYGLVIPLVKVYIFAAAVILTLALYLFISRTKIGKAIRATRMDTHGARITGVHIGRIYIITYGLAAAMAGAAGSVLSVIYTVSPFMGERYLFNSFVICALGGYGNVAGALIGGIVFGEAQAFGSALVGSGYSLAISFVVLLFTLMVRPYGIFGKEYY